MKKCLLVLLSFVFMVVACGSPPVSTPAPTPQAINLVFPPALQPWADKLSVCASNNPLVALYFNPSSPSGNGILPNDIQLTLGHPAQVSSTTYFSQVGLEQIDVVVNRDNPYVQLSTDKLRAIFSGKQTTWNDSSSQPIHVWVLPVGDPVRLIFDQALMHTQTITSDANLAPDPAAMLEAISQDINSIGYLPASFLNSSGLVDPGELQTVQLDQSLETALDQPVVVLTQGEPQGLLRSLLVCLDSSIP